MKQVFGYIKSYAKEINKLLFLLVASFTALLIYLNYHFLLDERIDGENSFLFSFIARYVQFLLAYAIPWIISKKINKASYGNDPVFLALILVAPAIFSLKMAMSIPLRFSSTEDWNTYWNIVFYWPLRLLIVGGILFITWKLTSRERSFYGISTKPANWKPYLLMLLFMVPLIAVASTQADFQAMYPKMKLITAVYDDEALKWWHKLLFELSYGSDFIGIELFFRGFLIIAFIKLAGKDAILPMACFYCCIHFGKPLGECISSFFGGIVLGIVSYHTRSILGGLMVHLGIAWMMELGGWVGNG
jgi:hypothetical protein